MRAFVVIAAALTSAFLIVSLTASVLESWASARRSAESAYMIADQQAAARATTSSAFLSTTRSR
jgi:hypothetical protein